MPSINDIQKNILTARNTANKEEQEYRAAKESLLKKTQEIQQLQRIFDPNDEAHIKKHRDLKAEEEKLNEDLTALIKKRKTNKDGILTHLTELISLGDPKDQFNKLNADHPVLLFPLRLETRFKKVINDNSVQDELWIRIYPDDCQVETFSEMISEGELKNIQNFHQSFWAAGGFEEQKKAAWRSLVNAVGSGRATWLYNTYKPTNEAAIPTKANQSDLLLIFKKDATLTGAEEDAAIIYWKDLWLADTDNNKKTQANNALIAATSNAIATYITTKVIPFNIQDPTPAGKKRSDITVATHIIEFPANPPVPVSTTTWTQAPAVRTLPECFVITGFNNGTETFRKITNLVPDDLHVGPDPSLPDSEQMKHVNGELEMNKELQWLTDFEQAIAKGMAKKISLTPQQAAKGFDKILVTGIRLSTDADASAKLVSKLFSNHYYSSNGFGILPQGTPTNNTEQQGSGYNSLEDPDLSYNILFNNAEAFTVTANELEKTDGQWLSDALGIAPDLFKKIPNSAGLDQQQARAMNTAIWPATWGYFFEEMMSPAINRNSIAMTRHFFNHFVSGRGPLPAIRIGKQPYGILPATSFAALRFTVNDDRLNFNGYLNQLHDFLGKMDIEFTKMAKDASTIAKPGDPHQQLLDIVGLHPSSVEFYQRYAQSFTQLYNELVHRYGSFYGGLFAAFHKIQKQNVLTASGVTATPDIPILDKYFLRKQNQLKGDVIDDQPLSEINKIKPYAGTKNYITWLIESNIEQIRNQDFGGAAAPHSLLYLWLRHGLLLSYWDGALNLYESRAKLDTTLYRKEPDHIHLQKAQNSESKFDLLYRPEQQVTDHPQMLVADYVSQKHIIKTLAELRSLSEVKNALSLLENASTAKLERLFAETMDTCTYRLDAWKNGLINYRLQEMRKPTINDNETQPATGTYIGAYGYLENVRSENKVLTDAAIPEELKELFRRKEGLPLKDSTNSGYIHAPSIAQASTAAVLKSAYISQADPADAETYSINLNSERVRKAQMVLEGVRNGQSLRALLGYQFERGLHDKHNLAEVDKFIYPLRKVCPLVADKMNDTGTAPTVSIESLEARNVIDGLELVKKMKQPGNENYPFGFTGLRTATPAEALAINTEARNLLDTHDAISDMTLSENVYQLVQGNFDRAAAISDAISKGGYPPEIEVVKTPRTGRNLSNRFVVHFDTTVPDNVSPFVGLNLTPRAIAEAPVNNWLAALLPAPDKVICTVNVKSHIDQVESAITISQKELGLQPIDTVFAAGFDSQQSMTELDDRITHFLRYDKHMHPMDAYTISYTTPAAAGNFSFFETSAMIRSLKKIVLRSNYLKPENATLTQETGAGKGEFDTGNLKTRISNALIALTGHIASLQALQANNADDIDVYVKTVSEKLSTISFFGISQTGFGYLHDAMHGLFAQLINKLNELIKRWDKKKTDFTTLDILFAAAATDPEKIEILERMESIISTSLTPAPHALPGYRTAVDLKKTNFDIVYTTLKAHITTGTEKLSVFITDVTNDAAGIPAFDSVALDTVAEKNDLSVEVAAVAALRTDIQNKLGQLIKSIGERQTKINALFTEADKKDSLYEKIDTLLQAGKLVLGDELLLIPRFKFSADQTNELSNALAPANTTQLLKHLKDNLQIRFPVDNWLYSLARVKEKIFHWENITALADAFGRTLNEPTPLQFPFQANDSWLALEYPAGYKFESEKVLYTASLPAAYDPAGWQAGLLIEEWTEVIPSTEETTGISFHYDQPNTEPPQVILLMVPPVRSKTWNWDHFINGIHETFEMAKTRAVEPSQVDNSIYGQFLPATIMAVTLYQLSIMTNLAANNEVYTVLNKNNN